MEKTNPQTRSFELLHASLLAAASLDPTQTRLLRAAYSPSPHESMYTELDRIITEILHPTSSSRLAEESGASVDETAPDTSPALGRHNLDLTISLTVKRSTDDEGWSVSVTRARLCKDGEVLQEIPSRPFDPLAVPTNAPTSRRFGAAMRARGWTAALCLYRAVAQFADFKHRWVRFPTAVWNVERKLRQHEAQLARFPRCAPLVDCLTAGDSAGAFKRAYMCVEQLVGRRIDDPAELLAAAKSERDRTLAQIFMGDIPLPRRERDYFGLRWLLTADFTNDTNFLARFALMTIADASSQALDAVLVPNAHCAGGNARVASTHVAANAHEIAPDQPGCKTETPGTTVRRHRALGGGLRPLIPEEPSEPRAWVLSRLESMHSNVHHDLQGTLRTCRDLLAVLEPDNARKLRQLLADRHRTTYRAIRHAAADVQGLIDNARSALRDLDRTMSNCIDALNSRRESMTLAQEVLRARDEFARANRCVSDAFEASGETLREHLQVLEHAQARHVSKELDALIAFIEARLDVERCMEVQRVMESVKGMRPLADRVITEVLNEWG